MNAHSDSPAPDIRLRGASLSYQGKTVFENLDLDLQGGRLTCLLGPSGVGKSSLLRYIAGLSDADGNSTLAGKLSFGGTGAKGETGAKQAGIAYLAQQDLLLPWLSALDNVLLGSWLRGEPADRSRALDLLARTGLEGQHDLHPAQLSGGMRQRVALARTLMEDRPVVLMDEPFSALDAITRFELQQLAATLLAGRTTLLVTHDPLEALRIGHRLLLLRGSPARFADPIDPPGAPLRDPASPEVAALQSRIMRELSEARLMAPSDTPVPDGRSGS